uniref:Uncharacterized protein n=1 Tax=Cannabis sativa TaxID=3483 RepID=A0A803Q076_CANSA
MLVQDRVGPKSSKQTQIKSLPTHHHPGRLSEPKNLDFSTWVSENLYKVVHVLFDQDHGCLLSPNVGDTAALLCFENHVEALEKIEFPKVWDAATGAKQYTFEGHESIVYSVCPHYKENIQVLSITRKCLLDFVKEENLRKSAENCSSSHRQFESKVSQFKQMFNEIHRKMDEVFSRRASPPIGTDDQRSPALPFEISEVLQQKSAPFGNLLVSIGWYFHLALVGTWHL